MARQVWDLTANAPSYDGQFGPAVSAMGAQGTARLQGLSDRLRVRAEYLAAKAAAFEAADAEAAEGLWAISSQVPEWIESGGHLLSDRSALESYNRHLALILLANRYLHPQQQEQNPGGR